MGVGDAEDKVAREVFSGYGSRRIVVEDGKVVFSIALVSTQTGLMVSIPGLYMGGFLTRRANNLKTRIAATGMYLKRYL